MEVVVRVPANDTASFVLQGWEQSELYCMACGRKGIYRKIRDDGTSVVFRKFACVCGYGFEAAEHPYGQKSDSCLVPVILEVPGRISAVVYVIFGRSLYHLISQTYQVMHEHGCYVEELTDGEEKTVMKGTLWVPESEREQKEATLRNTLISALSCGAISVPETGIEVSNRYDRSLV